MKKYYSIHSLSYFTNYFMSRYLGVYNPKGFPYNRFMIFYTKKPIIYSRAIDKQAMVIKGSNKLYIPGLYFTNKEYKNYKNIHKSLCSYLDNESYQQKGNNNGEWPVIDIQDFILCGYPLHNLDDLVDRALTESKE